MPSQKVNFRNKLDYTLATRLELPFKQHPHNFDIIAHSFIYTKNLSAVRNISRALNMEGIAVLRFDFTGLGESEGEFSETNFSSNIEDLLAAATFLSENYMAPSMLIGHSLGGAAVISAASKLESVRTVATIGAPFDPAHVSHLFGSDLETIEAEGNGAGNIGGRRFRVKKQFLDDIKKENQLDNIKNLGKALLILHSPQDRTVDVGNAAKIYKAAMHPKSFISLDGADHLLSEKADSVYVGDIIASWARRYLNVPEKEALQREKSIAVRLGAEGFTTDIMVRQHSITADEPESVGGNDFGPSPYELLTAGLGACTAMTLQMYARRKKWDLQEVRVHLDHYKDYATDMENVEDAKSRIDHFDRIIEVDGNLDETQKQRLLEIANKCPVHRTLHSNVKIISRLK